MRSGTEPIIAVCKAGGMICFGAGDPRYERYHDEEWGRPVHDERGLYEKLCLEAFQSGLAWITILRKRDAFRTAFADFDPERVAQFGRRDIARLLADAGIVRNRLKVEAAIANAKATVELHDGPKPLPELIWDHAPTGRAKAPRSWNDVAPLTPESTALSKELKRRGFRFVGATTVYALMQACGLVNDHLAGCRVRADVERAREARVDAGPSARPAPRSCSSASRPNASGRQSSGVHRGSETR